MSANSLVGKHLIFQTVEDGFRSFFTFQMFIKEIPYVIINKHSVSQPLLHNQYVISSHFIHLCIKYLCLFIWH